MSVTTDSNGKKPGFFGFDAIAPCLNSNKGLYEPVLFVVAEDDGIYQRRGKITLTMPANYNELQII
ncbi:MULTISPECIES: hypothetical protein [unclassified Microcoleus]|uniref:hypothetical protein n=1 Tax=unclassified Microcoleus TaxID=2642155 RepID=UPI002FCEEB65